MKTTDLILLGVVGLAGYTLVSKAEEVFTGVEDTMTSVIDVPGAVVSGAIEWITDVLDPDPVPRFVEAVPGVNIPLPGENIYDDIDNITVHVADPKTFYDHNVDSQYNHYVYCIDTGLISFVPWADHVDRIGPIIGLSPVEIETWKASYDVVPAVPTEPESYPVAVTRGIFTFYAGEHSAYTHLQDFLGIDPEGLDLDTYLNGLKTKAELMSWYIYWVDVFEAIDAGTSLVYDTYGLFQKQPIKLVQFVLAKYRQYKVKFND